MNCTYFSFNNSFFATIVNDNNKINTFFKYLLFVLKNKYEKLPINISIYETNGLFFNNNNYQYGMSGLFKITNKDLLALELRYKQKWIPLSFVFNQNNDMTLFIKHYILTNLISKNILFICKTNKQCQFNIKITSDKQFILKYFLKNKNDNNDDNGNGNGMNDGNGNGNGMNDDKRFDNYVVCQELLLNPFLINKRKINIRMYILIVIGGLNEGIYLFNDGFIYFAKKDFDCESEDLDVHITSAISDSFLNGPFTLKDLVEGNWMNKNENDFLMKNCIEMFHDLFFEKVWNELKKNNSGNGIRFNLLGCDIAPDSNFNIKIMEINQSPRLEWPESIHDIVQKIICVKGENSCEYNCFMKLIEGNEGNEGRVGIEKMIEKEIHVKKKLIDDMLKIVFLDENENNGFMWV